MTTKEMIELLERKTTVPELNETFDEISNKYRKIRKKLKDLGASEKILYVLERVSTIPEGDETFEEICALYDEAISILKRENENNMGRILYIADTHFCHRNIIKLNNRPFLDIDTMNRELIERWNNKVRNDDLVIHGGDFILGNDVNVAKDILEQLHGKIILIKGNHDKLILKNKELRNRFEGIYDIYEISDNNVRIVISHYPMLEWSKMYRGSQLYYGHIHNNVENDTYHIMKEHRKDNAFNIGCDILDYEPCTSKEIIERNKIFQRTH